jgi:hypothetical protein
MKVSRFVDLVSDRYDRPRAVFICAWCGAARILWPDSVLTYATDFVIANAPRSVPASSGVLRRIRCAVNQH